LCPDIYGKDCGTATGRKYLKLLNNTSKPSPTYHDKIMIAEEKFRTYESLHNDIEDLIEIASFLTMTE
jgi:hypothetical protein